MAEEAYKDGQSDLESPLLLKLCCSIALPIILGVIFSTPGAVAEIAERLIQSIINL